ncbi:winged helix-turn-helix transcriptional regulator, partial [Streptomyces sp. NPDC002623]
RKPSSQRQVVGQDPERLVPALAPLEDTMTTTDYLPGLTRAFALLGRRWNGPILAALAHGPVGFGQLRERIPGISDRMLADRRACEGSDDGRDRA